MIKILKITLILFTILNLSSSALQEKTQSEKIEEIGCLGVIS